MTSEGFGVALGPCRRRWWRPALFSGNFGYRQSMGHFNMDQVFQRTLRQYTYVKYQKNESYLGVTRSRVDKDQAPVLDLLRKYMRR